MGRHDWYRNTAWSPEVAAAFETKLSRSRSGRSQYLRIQACVLTQSEPLVALGLLDRYFAEEPEDRPHFDHAQALVDKAAALRSLGRTEQALDAYDAALAHENLHRNYQTSALIELPFLVATTPIPARYRQALDILDRRTDSLIFPVQRFKCNAASALISSAIGVGDVHYFAARALEAAAETQSGLAHHKSLGLVGDGYDDLVALLAQLVR